MMTWLKTGTVSLTVIALAGGAVADERSGAFEGASGHEASGTVTVEGSTVTFGDDFTFDGAPDPQVALGNDGYDADTLFAPLEADTGRQTYELPEGIDPAGYNEVWIWCEEFDVPLAVAPLEE